MAEPKLVPCLVVLRNEFNQLNPVRDRRSDGWIGDRAHQDRPSDHNPDETGETPYTDADDDNEVHALDVDHTGPWPSVAFASLVDEIVKRHRLGLDDRLQNVIYDGRIASRSWGWTWRTHTGSNAHREHAHFSARYVSAHESNTKPWGLVARFITAREEPYVSVNDDLITLTPSTAKELGGDYKAGTKHSAASLIQLAVIYAARADDKANEAKTAAVAARQALSTVSVQLDRLLAQQGSPDTAPDNAQPAPDTAPDNAKPAPPKGGAAKSTPGK